MNSFKNMNVCIKTYDDPFQTSWSGFKCRTNRRTSAAHLKMLTLALFLKKSRLWLELSLSLLPPYLCLWPHWICQCLHAELLAMSSYGSYSPLTLSIISARHWNSNKASYACPKTWRYLFTPKLSAHGRLSCANTWYTVIHTSQVTGIVLRTGLSLAPGDSERPVWISEWQNVSAGCTRRYLSRGLQFPHRNPIQTVAWKHAAFQCSRHRVHR